jgi:multimeric flavodoxin WrbA
MLDVPAVVRRAGVHAAFRLASASPSHVYTMPKTLVLFHGNSKDIVTLADAVADGVRSVRFAEVDVRRLADEREEDGAGRARVLGGADELAAYDGLVLGTDSQSTVPDAVTQLLADAGSLRQQKALGTSVGAAFVAGASAPENEEARWTLLRALGALGLVLEPASVEGADSARQLGHRVAHVVSWITHARSHHH